MLAQRADIHIFGNGDEKGPGAALRNKHLSIHDESARAISALTQSLVRLDEMPSFGGRKKTHDIFRDEKRRFAAAAMEFIDDSHPVPEQAGPGAGFYALQITGKREILTGKGRPGEIGLREIGTMDLFDGSEVKSIAREIGCVNSLLFGADVVGPEGLEFRFEAETNQPAAGKEVESGEHFCRLLYYRDPSGVAGRV